MPSSGIVTRILEHFWNHEYRHYYEGSIKRGANVFFSKNSEKNAIPNESSKNVGFRLHLLRQERFKIQFVSLLHFPLALKHN